MGIFDKRRQKKEELLAEERRRQAEERKEQIESMRRRMNRYASYEEMFDEFDGSTPIVPKKGEQVIGIAHGVSLTETRRGKATYQGGSRGVSVRVAKGVSYRVGSHKGQLVQAPERPTVIDGGGDLVVSNLRAVYVGSKHTREFRWDKLLSCSLVRVDDKIVFLLPVENRQKVSGIAARSDGEMIEWIDERIKLGVAIHQDRLDEFLQSMQEEIDELTTRYRSELPSLG